MPDCRRTRPVFFFDIDNCLYSNKLKVHETTTALVDGYLVNTLSLDPTEAHKVRMFCISEYGLIVKGLATNYGINPLDFNTAVDDSLPLEDLLQPSLELQKLFADIDKSKVQLWLFTNAYITHGMRVVQLLGIEDYFEGITYCDYTGPNLLCKPSKEMFYKAMREASIEDPSMCYIIDDSAINCSEAAKIGWTAVHFIEDERILSGAEMYCQHQVRDMGELRTLFPQFFINY